MPSIAALGPAFPPHPLFHSRAPVPRPAHISYPIPCRWAFRLQKGAHTFGSKAGWGGHASWSALPREVEGGKRAWFGPTGRCQFLGGPFPPDSKLRKERGPRSRPPRLPVPGGGPRCLLPRAAPSARRRCARPARPTWGLRTLGRLWPPRARRAAAPGLPSVGCGPPPGEAAGGAGRGGGPRPRRAPFERCQGLIDEKWPRAGANLSREAARRRAGAPGGGGCFAGAQLSKGHYRWGWGVRGAGWRWGARVQEKVRGRGGRAGAPNSFVAARVSSRREPRAPGSVSAPVTSLLGGD